MIFSNDPRDLESADIVYDNQIDPEFVRSPIPDKYSRYYYDEEEESLR